MIITYTVELTTKETFTARKKDLIDMQEVTRWVNNSRNMNKKLKYQRYSNFKLYTNNMIHIKNLNN